MRSDAARALAAIAESESVLLSGVSLPAPTAAAAAARAAAAAHAAAPAEAPVAASAAGPEPVYDDAAQADIQGWIVPGFNSDHQQYLFLRFGDLDGARSWLRALAPSLSTLGQVQRFRAQHRAARLRLGVREPGMSATWRGLALSWPGIAALLGRDEANIFGDRSFRQGMAERSTYLGDPADPRHPGHRNHWVIGGPDHPADALVVVAADVPADLTVSVSDVLALAESHGLTTVFTQVGRNLPGNLAGHEHFGFKDGISQPGVRGYLSRVDGAGAEPITPRLLDDGDPHAALCSKPGQVLLWPGQFLLGEPRQDPQDPLAAAAPSSAFPDWARRGSYLVCRRLLQDVAGFWDDIAEAATELALDPVSLAARLVGRWPSGAPVSRTPDADDPELAGDEFAHNHFLFDDDTRGFALAGVDGYPGDHHPVARADMFGAVCPHSAHIRKVNPRDSATDLGAPADTLMRLMLRRGIPYGPPMAGVPHPTPDLIGADRGLIFAAFMSSIEDQFEFVSRRWVNSPVLPHPGGPDPIVGQRDRHGARRRSFVVPGANGPRVVSFGRDHVIPTGGGYFFAPPVSAVAGALGRQP